MKKLLSVVLALLMLAVMLPVVAMADDANYCTIEVSMASSIPLLPPQRLGVRAKAL